MPSFEQMRDRLPSLYRPEDDDASGDSLPLAPEDVLEIASDPPRTPSFTMAGGAVVATLDAPARVRRVRLAPGRAPGTGCALEIYRMEGTLPRQKPAVAVGVRGGVAELTVPFDDTRFGIRLRRPGLIAMLLRAFGETVDEADREATGVLQSHWFGYADRVLLSPVFFRGRELRGLAMPRQEVETDVLAPAAVAARLRAGADPLAAYLRAQLSPATLQLLEAAPGEGPVPDTLQLALAEELDRLAHGPLLYTEERFAEVELSDAALAAVADPPTGPELRTLNRALLSEAFAGGVAPTALDSVYVRDLARMGSLLTTAPWTEPAAERETVEEFRQRVARLTALYRNGLGTPSALRSMVEAQLLVDRVRPAEQRDRGLGVEEIVPLGARSVAVQADGEPTDRVGPLMRWTLNNGGIGPARPTLYVQGVAPEGDRVAATDRPLVELYAAGDARPRLGIAYDATLAPDQTLRLRPAFASWLAREDGVLRADSLPTGDAPADPTAPGPWTAFPEPPDGPPASAATVLRQAHDRTLWAAFATDDGAELWRFDGREWAAALTGLPAVHALDEDGADLLVGTDEGLLRVGLYPATGTEFTSHAVAAAGTDPVYALHRLADGRLLVATGAGVVALAPGDTAAPFVLDASTGTAVPVYAVSRDAGGTLYFGSRLGVFQHHPADGYTYWYAGGEHSDQVSEWRRLQPEKAGDPPDAPAGAEVFLPPVRCVHRGRDASLWLGTEAGIARYVARAVRGPTYTTLLEAFPDLTTGPVHRIREDERGEVWFCTDRGLFRYDGRDWWQHQDDTWVQLGRADSLYDGEPRPRPAYRWRRASKRWQTWDERGAVWVDVPAGTPRSTAEPAVHDVAWTDTVAADLGGWDGSTFTRTGAADPERLAMRHKPAEDRVVGGGIPALPRIPEGNSTWRYLSLEGDDPELPPDRPSWTVEGRLLPPPQREAPYPGRYDATAPPAGYFDQVVYAFPPAARVWFGWEERRPLTALVRLRERFAGESLDPVVVDRVWQGIQQVRPAGVRVLLALGETIVRGKQDAAPQ
ncbi:MAG: PQQ-like beta-propeller repeat protein [Gemmatimonadetes bacterium]|nr:PQQ-like beta-propeller repeat protein [Gemmatimonadota bacterium]